MNSVVSGTVFKCLLLKNEITIKTKQTKKQNQHSQAVHTYPVQNRLLLVVHVVSSSSRIAQNPLLVFHHPDVQARIVPTQGNKAACAKWKMIKHAELDALPNQ